VQAPPTGWEGVRPSWASTLLHPGSTRPAPPDCRRAPSPYSTASVPFCAFPRSIPFIYCSGGIALRARLP
jgi:hypothetical protein